MRIGEIVGDAIFRWAVLPALGACLVVTFLPTEGTAAAPVTARDLALGGGGAAFARGVETLWSNPANLAAARSPGFSIMLLTAAAGASSNSLTIDQYNRFAAPGTHLSSSDKSEILNSISDEEFKVAAEAGASALGFTIGPFGFAVSPRTFGVLSLARDYFELLLNGNEFNRTYSFDGTSGESVAFLETALYYGRRSSWVPLRSGRWGMSWKFFHGPGGYFEVLDAQGHLVTYRDKAEGEAMVKIRYSGTAEEVAKDGGDEWEYTRSSCRGMGFDFGIGGQVSSRWEAALVIRDLLSSITWDTGTEKYYYYRADSLTVENAEDDDLIVDEEYERSLSSFKTSLPTTLHLEFARKTRRFLLTMAYNQGFRTFAGVSTTPGLSFGSEMRLLRWLPLRSSLSFGGGRGSCVGAGFGLHFGAFRLDLGLLSRGLTPGGTKGILCGLTTYLLF